MQSRKQLEDELAALKVKEASIDGQLIQYFSSISSSNFRSKAGTFDGSDLENSMHKLEKFAPCLEAMTENAKKLATQVEDCRQLSDRISMIVRRLDVKQMRAQQALACTEDIINLKDCKVKMNAAIEEKNLPLAVGYVRQVHDIDLQALKTSDDYVAIQQSEATLREMVQSEFSKAIEASNIGDVMSLCPLLQTLGLETVARDSFLEFVETTVFIAVSADASSVDGATDPAMGYAQALSNVFNSTCMIFQKYLPIVIQGMGNSHGDVYFIRRLHAKCEKEAGLVLKRYVKYRNMKDIVNSLKSSSNSGASFLRFSSGGTAGATTVTQADMHVILDEIALLAQYCCMYSKYFSQLCNGADNRLRLSAKQSSAPVPNNSTPSKGASSSSTETITAVFPKGVTEFDKIVDDFVNKYYLECEKWLMKQGLNSGLTSISPVKGATGGALSADADSMSQMGLDECFFVLKRCGQRALATNNIHVACAVLYSISNLLSTDLLNPIADQLNAAATRVANVVNDNVSRYLKRISSKPEEVLDDLGVGGNFALQFKSAITIASSLTASTVVGGVGAVGGGSSSNSSTNAGNLTAGGVGGTVASGGVSDCLDEDDPWGVANIMGAFNNAEKCMRYIDRLNKDIVVTGKTIFGAEGAGGSSSGGSNSATSDAKKSAMPSNISSSSSSEIDKLKLCQEDFDGVKQSYSQAIRHAVEKMSTQSQTTTKEILMKTLGPSGPYGGIRFDLPEASFQNQEALSLLPRIVILPFETMIAIMTSQLSESNKDMIVAQLAEMACERLEHFISQTPFLFAGAIKFEEITRAISALFISKSSVSLRGKFSRLREVMMIMTCDVHSTSSLQAENFTHLTTNEILAFLSYRIDSSK